MTPTWHKSSHSGGTNCAEVAVMPGPVPGAGYMVAVRDSKDPDGPMLTFAPADWHTFIDGLKTGPLEA